MISRQMVLAQEKGQALRRVTTLTKLLYGVGGVADASKTAILGLFLLFFYTMVVGLPAWIVGTVIAIGLVWDAIIDPYIGYLSDITRFRLGRRHTYMLIGSALMGLSFWGLFSPIRALPTWGLVCWLLVASLLVRSTVSLFTVPYYALGAEMSTDYHERTSIASSRGGLALFGTLAAATLSFFVFFPSTASGSDPKLNPEGYAAMGLTFGLAMTSVGLIATLCTLRYRTWARATGDGPRMARSPASLFGDTLMALKNRSFRAVFSSLSLFFLAVVINGILSVYFLNYYAEVTEGKFLSLLQGGLYGGALVGVVFWLRIARVMEKRWLCFVATWMTALGMLGAVLLFGEDHVLGVGNVKALLAGHILVGFFVSILWVMPLSMIADVADEDELAMGRRREGMLYGVFYFGQQIAASVAVLITGVFVGWYAGLASGQAVQSQLTVQRIAVLYGLLPAALLVISAIIILRYSLDQTKVTSIQTQLLGRHAASDGPG